MFQSRASQEDFILRGIHHCPGFLLELDLNLLIIHGKNLVGIKVTVLKLEFQSYIILIGSESGSLDRDYTSGLEDTGLADGADRRQNFQCIMISGVNVCSQRGLRHQRISSPIRDSKRQVVLARGNVRHDAGKGLKVSPLVPTLFFNEFTTISFPEKNVLYLRLVGDSEVTHELDCLARVNVI